MKFRIFVFSVLFLMSGILTAKAKLAVLPFSGRGEKSTDYGKELTENLKMMMENISGVSATYYTGILDRRIGGRIVKCGTDLNCMERYVERMKNADFVLLPLVARGSATVVRFYIYDRKGKTVAKDMVKESANIDSIDLIAPIIEKINELVRGLGGGSRETVDRTPAPREESRPSVAERSVERVSASEQKQKYREGFRHYKKGAVEKAIIAYKQAGKDRVAKAVDFIADRISRAENAIENREYDRAVDLLTEAENKDVIIRKYGYKELEFIRKTHRRHLYQKGSDRQYKAVDRILGRIKKDIQDLGKWKMDEIAKARSVLNEKSNLRNKINRDYEEKSREIERQQEKKKAEIRQAIKDAENKLANLDSKYRRKIRDIDREAEKLNQEMEDNRSFEEKYRREIQQELRSLENNIEKKKKELELAKRRGIKKREEAIRAYEKKMEKTLETLQKENRKIDEQIQRLTRAIDNARETVDKRLNAAREKFEKSLSKKREEDRRDIKKVEEEFRKKEKELNKKLDEYNKKIQEAVKKVDEVDRETAGEIEKAEKRLEIAIRRADKQRNKVMEETDRELRETRDKAEKEYEKKIREAQKEMDAVDDEVMKYESNHTDYAKHRKYRVLMNKRKQTRRKLAAVEDNYDSFIKRQITPVEKKKQQKIAAVERKNRAEQQKLKKQIAVKRAQANKKRKTAQANVRRLEKRQPAHEKQIRAQIRAAEKKMDADIKKIEARETQRRKKFEAKLQAQRARLEQQIQKRVAELKRKEKELEAHGKKIENTRRKMTAHLDKLRTDLDRYTAATEQKNRKLYDNLDRQYEQGRSNIMKKYEQKAANRKEEIKKELDAQDQKMKNLLEQRRKEKIALQNSIDANEKKLVQLQRQWDKQAEARQRKRQQQLKWAEKEQAKAKARFEAAKNKIDREYQARFDKIIAKHLPSLKSAGDREFKVERDRSYEYSALTKKILNAKAKAYDARGDAFLDNENLRDAQEMYFKAIYAFKDSPDAKKGLKKYNAKIASLYKKASDAFDSGDAMMAEDILKKIVDAVNPANEYYLKSKALMMLIKSS
ncbi:MAG: hypothetical protein R6W70_02850 [bacterium]